MQPNWKHKYLKYKKKYIMYKQQVGGNSCVFDNDDKWKDRLIQIFSESIQSTTFAAQPIISRCFIDNKEPLDFIQTIKTYLNNDNEYIISTLDDRVKHKLPDKGVKIHNLIDNGNYTIIMNNQIPLLNMYNLNLFIGMFPNVKEDKMNYTNFINRTSYYIKNQIASHQNGFFKDSTIYLGIAVYNQTRFYVPQFIIDQLSKNQDLRYTVIIIHDDYVNAATWDRDITKNNIINDVKRTLHPNVSSRMLFIHVMMKFPTIKEYSDLYKLFSENIVVNDGINYCYIGFKECGLLFSGAFGGDSTMYDQLKNLNINYVFVGCDGLFYTDKKIVGDFKENPMTDNHIQKLIGLVSTACVQQVRY